MSETDRVETHIGEGLSGPPPISSHTGEEPGKKEMISGPDQLVAIARLPKNGQTFGPYSFDENCIFRITGESRVLASSFQAVIAEEKIRHSIKGETRAYVIVGRQKDGTILPPVEVDASDYRQMRWVEQWGASCVLGACQMRDHVRAAIQQASGTPPVRHVYRHTGHAVHDGTRVYIHAGGAIGTNGANPDLDAELYEMFSHIHLPPPAIPGSPESIRAIRASLDLRDFHDRTATIPLLAATYAAPLTPFLRPDFVLHLSGGTGTGKTTLAKAMQSHFTLRAPADEDLGSFFSTPTANELLLGEARDILLVMDDLVPTGSRYQDDKLIGDAARVYRGVGNLRGRDRGTKDLKVTRGHGPRAIVIATGEDLPPGVESAIARSLIVEITTARRDEDELDRVKALQDAGTFSRAMAGYIQWVLGRYERLAASLPIACAVEGRLIDSQGLHTRTPRQFATLLCAHDTFLEYAVEEGAITEAERASRREEALCILHDLALAQAEYHVEKRPGERSLDVLRSSVRTKHAYLMGLRGEVPLDAEKFGWQIRSVQGEKEQRTSGSAELIGWTDNEYVYLDKIRAHSHVQRTLTRANELGVGTSHSWARALKREGLLIDTEEGRTTVRLPRNRRRKPALKMHVDVFLGEPTKEDE